MDLCAGYAHAKVLSCLVHIGRSDVAPDNAVGIRRNLSAYYARPAFENNNLVELFSFRVYGEFVNPRINASARAVL